MESFVVCTWGSPWGVRCGRLAGVPRPGRRAVEVERASLVEVGGSAGPPARRSVDEWGGRMVWMDRGGVGRRRSLKECVPPVCVHGMRFDTEEEGRGA